MTRLLVGLVLGALVLGSAPALAWDGWDLFQCGYDSITGKDYQPCEYKGTYASSSACSAAGVAWCTHLTTNAKIKEYCTNPTTGAITTVCARN